MKKIITTVLTLTMAATMSVTAFAGETTLGNGGTKDIDVSAKYAGGIGTPKVYSVDVVWGDMQFTYTESGNNKWDPSTHQYTVDASSNWAATGNEIAVTNHSNAPVKAEFVFDADAAYNTIGHTFSQTSLNLPTAEGKDTNAAELTGTTALTLNGKLASTVTDYTTVGQVTVTIKGE